MFEFQLTWTYVSTKATWGVGCLRMSHTGILIIFRLQWIARRCVQNMCNMDATIFCGGLAVTNDVIYLGAMTRTL